VIQKPYGGFIEKAQREDRGMPKMWASMDKEVKITEALSKMQV